MFLWCRVGGWFDAGCFSLSLPVGLSSLKPPSHFDVPRVTSTHTSITILINVIMTPTASASASLLKVITKPSKVASNLDWRKGSSILSMDIHKDHVGLCVANHPSTVLLEQQSQNHYQQPLCQTLEPIRCPPGRSIRSSITTLTRRLEQLVVEHNVCGIVVAWPLQHDTARMGAACGRVLFTLEHIMMEQEQKPQTSASSSVLTPNRPVCLWDSEHRIPQQQGDPQQLVDSWGRCPAYAHTSEKEQHLASQEQYYEDEGIVAAKVWEDFSKVHWPELFFHQETQQEQQELETEQMAMDRQDQVISLAPTSIWERTAPVVTDGTGASNRKSPSPLRVNRPKTSASSTDTISLINKLATNKRKSLIHMRS